MNRRALLKALPAAAVAGAVPAVVVASEESPIQRLFREWKARRHWLESLEAVEMSDGDFNAICGKNDDLAALIARIPCQSPADFAAKVLVSTMDGLNDFNDTNLGMRVLAEARALVA